MPATGLGLGRERCRHQSGGDDAPVDLGNLESGVDRSRDGDELVLATEEVQVSAQVSHGDRVEETWVEGQRGRKLAGENAVSASPTRGLSSPRDVRLFSRRG